MKLNTELNVFRNEEEKAMYIVISYAVYLLVTLAVTVWTARTLHSSGRVFLVDAFHGNELLADSVNRLLVVGFYLINVGYVALALETQAAVDSARQAIELVSGKIGMVLLVLGVMHFFNLYVFNAIRRRNRPPVLPPPPPLMAPAPSR
jgi:hypothetical protein